MLTLFLETCYIDIPPLKEAALSKSEKEIIEKMIDFVF
ncbi:hypothetical protein QY96_01696 [Bacillus thermotolerans]|nr:hypothetical protein QY96_01696 [Bacillus thermotolerans]